MVQQLVSYAKKTFEYHVHQHIHHHYASNTQQDTNSRTQPNRFNVEPEDQLSRFQHFNYLPPLIEVPKLNSSQSSPNNSSYEGASGTTPTTTHSITTIITTTITITTMKRTRGPSLLVLTEVLFDQQHQQNLMVPGSLIL